MNARLYPYTMATLPIGTRFLIGEKERFLLKTGLTFTAIVHDDSQFRITATPPAFSLGLGVNFDSSRRRKDRLKEGVAQ